MPVGTHAKAAADLSSKGSSFHFANTFIGFFPQAQTPLGSRGQGDFFHENGSPVSLEVNDIGHSCS